MNCKNCNTPLQQHDRFCNNCGAKVITKRLTLKNLWQEFAEKFFNVESTLLKTFKAMFTQPEDVINGFINGVRRKYLNPINFFAISLTLGGILIFVLKNFYMDQFEVDIGNEELSKQLNEQTSSAIMDYQSLISMLNFPIYAIISKLVFIDRRDYNFTEHIVIYLYTVAQMSIVTFPITLTALFFGANFIWWSYVSLFFMIIYIAYCLKRVFNLSLKGIFLRSLFFIAVGLAATVLIGLVSFAIGVIGKIMSEGGGA